MPNTPAKPEQFNKTLNFVDGWVSIISHPTQIGFYIIDLYTSNNGKGFLGTKKFNYIRLQMLDCKTIEELIAILEKMNDKSILEVARLFDVNFEG